MRADTQISPLVFACLAMILSSGFGILAAEPQIDPVIYQRVVDENISLRHEQNRLSKENADLRRRNAELILDIQGLEAKRDQLAALVSTLRTPEETTEALNRLQAERSSMIAEVGRLRQALVLATSVTTNASAFSPGPEPGSALFRKIEQENADLRQQIERAREDTQAELKARETLLQQLAGQNTRLDKKIAEFEELKKERMQSQAKEALLRKAIEKLAHKSFQQQEEIDQLKAAHAKPETVQVQTEVSRPFYSPVGVAIGATAQVARSVVATVDNGPGADPFALAQRALKQGKTKDAERLYLQALQRTPKDPLTHYNLGVLYSDYLRDPEKAAYHFRKYLSLAPAAADADKVRAWLVELDMRAGQ